MTPVPDDLDRDLDLALRLADLADDHSLPRFGAADLQVTAKPDLTPVSDADLAVETAIRERIARERPDDVVVGEEFGGSDRPTGGRRWIVDPIDGTKNFVRGVPVWATLIALIDRTSTRTTRSWAWCRRRRWPGVGGRRPGPERSPGSPVDRSGGAGCPG